MCFFNVLKLTFKNVYKFSKIQISLGEIIINSLLTKFFL